MKDRKQLPAFLKLSYTFDMDKILDEFKKFENIDLYDDLNASNPDSSYGDFYNSSSKLDHLKKFAEDNEDVTKGSQFYRQLSLTEFDGDKSERKLEQDSNIKTYRKSTNPDDPSYDPVMDERRYTRRKDICTGYWNEILDTFKSPVTRTRFAYMAPGHSIKPHIDYNTTYSIRVHIPIVTNDQSIMCVKNKDGIQKMHMPADGGVYFLNTGMTHWAENNGSEGRIHLVISLNGQEDL
tara:strand:- start:332 stop:1042 length:711 start_codon:yes stop_codon:yes gene_type:complete